MTTKGSKNIEEPLEIKLYPRTGGEGPIEPMQDGGSYPSADSVVLLTWNISQETALMLQEADTKPYLLVAVSDGDHENEMSRDLVPLTKKGTMFLRFHRPGVNVVHATVVWSRGRADSPKKVLLARRDNGEFRTNVLRAIRLPVEQIREQKEALEHEGRFLYEPEDKKRMAQIRKELNRLDSELDGAYQAPFELHIRRDFDDLWTLKFEVQHVLEVPEAMFGKSWWITRFFGNYYKFWGRKAVDQCQLRRRALFTIPTLPFFFLFWGVVFTVGSVLLTLATLLTTGFLLLLGVRNLNFSALWKPWEEGPKGVYEDAEKSRWWWKKNVWDISSNHRQAVKYVLRPFVFAYLKPARGSCDTGHLSVNRSYQRWVAHR